MEGKTKDSTDQPVLEQIANLVAEEQELHKRGVLGEEDHSRLAEINVQLNQCWDLLRQRRARREFGQDPEQAHIRSAEVVENYEG